MNSRGVESQQRSGLAVAPVQLAATLLLTLACSGGAWAQAAPEPAPAATPAPANSTTSATPAVPPAPPAAQPTWRPDNRLIISGDGDSLSGVSGHGGGGSLGYLAQINPDALIGRRRRVPDAGR